MSDKTVGDMGFGAKGVSSNSSAAGMMSNEAQSLGGGVPRGSAVSTGQSVGAKSAGSMTVQDVGYTSSGVRGNSQASGMMSSDAKSHGGGVPKGGAVSQFQKAGSGK